ncbi:hypothetical protein [Aquimonas sp.]|jgi:hypothetical protein|uniref:hypothetical protein n=1 Tax=Aquimonas sp. TaxID=1872588 RepID=UPI0037C04CEC
MTPLKLPALLILLLLPLGAVANGRDDAPVEPPLELRDSVRRVERETGGRVLRVEPVRRGGQDTYRMKVLTPEGRIRVMQDDHGRLDSRRPSGRVEPPASREDRGLHHDD